MALYIAHFTKIDCKASTNYNAFGAVVSTRPVGAGTFFFLDANGDEEARAIAEQVAKTVSPGGKLYHISVLLFGGEKMNFLRTRYWDWQQLEIAKLKNKLDAELKKGEENDNRDDKHTSD